MAELRIKELEEKVAHYEAIMSKCPQCKTSLPAPEVEPATASSRHTRSRRSAQQPAAKMPPPTLTEPSKRPAPGSRLSLSARSSHKSRAASPTEPQAKNLQQCSPPILPAALSSRSRRHTEIPVSTPPSPSLESSENRDTEAVTSSAADSSARPASSSQVRSTHASSPALSVADGRHPHSGKLITLDLQQYKNSSSQNRGGRPPGESPKHAEWMRTAGIMLEEVPSGRHWRERLETLDSSVIAAVAMRAALGPEGDVSPTEDVERKELIRLVRRFAERHSEGRLNFQQFILVCLCQVLSSQGVPQGKILETLQICISDTSKANVSRYLKGTTWANKMMNDLFFTDWGYRAVDLIAIWNRSVATYGTIAVAPASRQYFITNLTQHKYFEGYQEVPDRRHDTIPWIVKTELGNEVSYRDVCEALGYSDEFFTKTEHLHSSNPSSPKVNADDMDDAGFQSRRDSFPTASQAQNDTSNAHRPASVDETPSNYPFSTSYLHDMSLRRKQLNQEDGDEDAAGRDPPTSRSVASQKTKRMIPDRSAKPLGDPDVSRRRRKPNEILKPADLPATSRGEPALSTQSAKRPLPESPTSAFQPTNASRRRQQPEERSTSEKTGPPQRTWKIRDRSIEKVVHERE